jgi:hypothetical protein
VDEPLPAPEILMRVVDHFRASSVGSPVSDTVARDFHSLLARALRIQAEMRMAPQDFERLDGMAREPRVEHDGCGNLEVSVTQEWAEKLDRMLHTWECLRCGAVVPGVPHGREECDGELARDVMES